MKGKYEIKGFDIGKYTITTKFEENIWLRTV